MTTQEIQSFSAIPVLERKTLLRIKQIEMLKELPEIEAIVYEMLCRAITVDAAQAEMALLAARQMCADRTVRRSIDELLVLASHLHDAALTDALILGDFA